MNLPKKIKIGHLDYTVEIVSKELADLKGYYGEIKPDEQEIKLGENHTDQRRADILLHEVLHALFKYMGIQGGKDFEENVIQPLSGGICAVMRDNPDLFPFLQKVLK